MNAKPKPARPIRLTGEALKRTNVTIDRRERQCCARCGKAIMVGGSRHHRQFRSRGGSDTVANLVLLCGSGTTGCHGWVHANVKHARAAGFAVDSWESPEDVPVQHAIYGWVWLDQWGGVHGTAPHPERGRVAA